MFHRRAVEVISAGFELDRADERVAARCSTTSARSSPTAACIPSDDVISVLVQAELDGERLTDEEICSFLRLLLPAGAETTYRSSTNLLVRPAHEPRPARRAARRPRAHAAGDRGRPALGAAAASASCAPRPATPRSTACSFPRVRSSRSTSAPRTTTRRCWDNPEEFDIFRPPRQHLAFAWGPHMCLGLHLARMETRVALTQLLDRLPGPPPRPRRRAARDHRRDLPRARRAPRRLGLRTARWRATFSAASSSPAASIR